MKTATLVIPFDSVAAGTAEELYVAIPWLGKWLVEYVAIAPNTALATAATNYTTVLLTASDGAGGDDSGTIAAYTSNTSGAGSIALVLKTVVAPTVTQPAAVLRRGHIFKLAKADTGTGQAHDACWTIGLRKVG